MPKSKLQVNNNCIPRELGQYCVYNISWTSRIIPFQAWSCCSRSGLLRLTGVLTCPGSSNKQPKSNGIWGNGELSPQTFFPPLLFRTGCTYLVLKFRNWYVFSLHHTAVTNCRIFILIITLIRNRNTIVSHCTTIKRTRDLTRKKINIVHHRHPSPTQRKQFSKLAWQ